MTTDDGVRAAVGRWLRAALEDVERRGLPELRPLLESLAESTIALREADWNDEGPGARSAAPSAGHPGEDGDR